MPLVIVTTNVSKSSAETEAALHDLSSATAAALNVPEKLAMVQLTLDTPMIFQGSTEPCAIIDFRTVGALEAKINKKIAAGLLEAVAKSLGVNPARVYVNLTQFPISHWVWQRKPSKL